MTTGQLILGIDNLIQDNFKLLKNKKIGLLVNQASFNKDYLYTFDIFLKQKSFKTKKIFSPQHGLFSLKQANMIESEDYFDKKRKVQIISLYGKKRSPLKKDLKE